MIRGLLVLALLAGLAPARALALDIDASVDRDRAGVGEQIVLTVVVNGTFRNLADPAFPELGDDFLVQDAGTSRNFSFINGRASSSISYRYVLVPRREGSFTVGPISVTHGDETVSTRPIALTVTRSTAPAPPALEGDGAGATSGSRDVFVRALVDRDDPYVSQQVTLRIQLYSALSLLDNPNFAPPSTEGFWREELPARPARIATLEGRRYQVMEVALALFPTRAGTLTIGPATLECRVRPARSSNDPFRSLGGSFFDGQRVVVETEPLTLEVKPLPSGAPEGFGGAVGDFRLATSADRTRVPQNEPVRFRVEIQGTGNLRSVGELELPDVPGFRAYPERSETQPVLEGDTLGGSVVQEFVLVPLRAGRLELPSLELPVFSPDSGDYTVLRSPAIPLEVTPAAAEGMRGVGSSRRDIETVGRDIRFLELEPPSFTRAEGGTGPMLRWLRFLPLPALAYLGFFAVERRRRRLAGDPRGLRRSRAARTARRRLRDAPAKTPEERAAVAADTLRAYVADRHDLPAAGVTAEGVLAHVGEEGAELVSFLERCDAVRFAPGLAASGGDPLGEAERWIERLEGAS